VLTLFNFSQKSQQSRKKSLKPLEADLRFLREKNRGSGSPPKSHEQDNVQTNTESVQCISISLAYSKVYQHAYI